MFGHEKEDLLLSYPVKTFALSLKGVDLKAYLANVSALENALREDEAGTSESFLECLSGYRQEKVRKLKMEKDRKLGILAGILTDRMLQENAGFRERDAQYFLTGNGKPAIKDAPAAFNLSHSGDYVLLVSALKNGREISVGCDLQKVLPGKEKAAAFCLDEREKDLYQSLDTPEERTDYFYTVWSMKESVLKADGQGIPGMRKLDLNERSDKTATICLPEEMCPKGYKAAVSIMIE